MVSAAFWFLATWFVFRRNQLVVSFIKCNCPSVMWVPLALTFLRLVHCIQNFPLWHVPVILGSKAFNFLSSLLLKLTMHAFVGKNVSFYSLCVLVNDNNQSHRRHRSLPESFCIRDLRWWSSVHLRSNALCTSLHASLRLVGYVLIFHWLCIDPSIMKLTTKWRPWNCDITHAVICVMKVIKTYVKRHRT